MNPVKSSCFILFFIICVSATAAEAQSYIVTDVAGLRKFGYSGDGGPATNAQLFNPMGVFVDNYNNVYISDWGNSRVRLVNPAGVIVTIAGNGTFGYSGDGGPASSGEFNGPMGITTDASGAIYVADIGNGRIRKITTDGIISTFAGNGKYGYSGDGGPALQAAFEDPIGICSDEAGNIYVADVFNNRVRKINSAGIVATFAGNGIRGYSGDEGQASLAEFYYPACVTADHSGNVYIADADNSCIRRVNTSGIISTFAGNGIFGSSGDGEPATLAELSNPSGIAIDKYGSVFIADGLDNRIRKIDTAGIITTIAGNGIAGYSGLGGVSTLAELYNPVNIVTDTAGNLYFANAFNNHIQKLSRIPNEVSPGFAVVVFPNPCIGIFNFNVQNFSTSLTAEIYNVLGQKITVIDLNHPATQVNLGANCKGIYIYRIISGNTKTVAIGKIVLM